MVRQQLLNTWAVVSQDLFDAAFICTSAKRLANARFNPLPRVSSPVCSGCGFDIFSFPGTYPAYDLAHHPEVSRGSKFVERERRGTKSRLDRRLGAQHTEIIYKDFPSANFERDTPLAVVGSESNAGGDVKTSSKITRKLLAAM